MDGMDNLLMTYRDMTTRDWLVDAAVALAAFAVGCLQLMLTASSIIIPDLALRQYLGVVNVVPDLQVFVGLGMTVVPLVLRRRFPLPVFAACLVIFLGLQVRFSGFSMTVVGPLVALYTVAAECGTVPGVACGAAAVLSLLFAGAPMQAASMVFFARFQNIALMVRWSSARPRPSARARRRPPAAWRRSACASPARCTTSRRTRSRR